MVKCIGKKRVPVPWMLYIYIYGYGMIFDMPGETIASILYLYPKHPSTC